MMVENNFLLCKTPLFVAWLPCTPAAAGRAVGPVPVGRLQKGLQPS
jgi:hypothetical protein